MEANVWKDIITVSLAAIGAVLGVMNTWNALNQRRVRLRVNPVHVITPNGMMFGIEVVNLSTFAVTIEEVGFTIGRTIKTGRRMAIPQPIVIDGQPWPRRLETHAAVTAYLDPRQIERGEIVRRAYARTACGEARYGTSGALKQLRQAMRD